MSLYNALFGMNNLAPVLLAMLDIDQSNGNWSSGRFRDAYLNSDGTEIEIYTRNGGGNREHWDFSYPDNTEGEECPCPGCKLTYRLPKHPNYIRDYDDDYDVTYAYIVFSVPDEYLELTKQLATGAVEPSVSDKFQEFISTMKASDK